MLGMKSVLLRVGTSIGWCVRVVTQALTGLYVRRYLLFLIQEKSLKRLNAFLLMENHSIDTV